MWPLPSSAAPCVGGLDLKINRNITEVLGFTARRQQVRERSLLALSAGILRNYEH